MHYAVAYFPDVTSESIHRIRKKYDPTEPIVEPHIAVVFPVPESVGEGNLVCHVEDVLSSWTAFSIRIRGFRKSFDHWLFLTLEDGYDDFVRLYCDMYTGLLAEYRRDDIEFIPHVGLGLFLKPDAQYNWDLPPSKEFDEPRYKKALLEAQEAGLDYRLRVESLHLMTIPSDVIEWGQGKRASLAEDSKVVKGREFALRKGNAHY